MNFLKKIKNFVLLTLTMLNFISWLVCGCLLDSDSWVYFYIWCVNTLWLVGFGLANFEEREDF